MKINQAGLKMIKDYEGLKLTSYPDPASPMAVALRTKGYKGPDPKTLSGAPWTIGYGSTGKDIGPNMTWTLEQAEARLRQHVTEFELGVERLVKVSINENQFSALVCFAYNVGSGALGKSTLMKLLNAGDTAGASAEFMKWNKAGGKEMAGLTKRRAAERALFDTPTTNSLPDGPSKEEIEVKLHEIEKEILK